MDCLEAATSQPFQLIHLSSELHHQHPGHTLSCFKMSDSEQNAPFTWLPASELCKVIVHNISGTGLTRDEQSIYTFLGEDYQLDTNPDVIRWIHLPVNNMNWVEVCVLQKANINLKTHHTLLSDAFRNANM